MLVACIGESPTSSLSQRNAPGIWPSLPRSRTNRSQQYRRPTLPFRHDIFRFEQVEQMALRWKDFSVTRTNGGADIFRLAGFLSDNNLISHDALTHSVRPRRVVF